eukprot:201250-Chlamydomonas_euryale.AAC.1
MRWTASPTQPPCHSATLQVPSGVDGSSGCLDDQFGRPDGRFSCTTSQPHTTPTLTCSQKSQVCSTSHPHPCTPHRPDMRSGEP